MVEQNIQYAEGKNRGTFAFTARYKQLYRFRGAIICIYSRRSIIKDCIIHKINKYLSVTHAKGCIYHKT